MSDAVFDLSLADVFNLYFIFDCFEEDLRIALFHFGNSFRNIVVKSVVQSCRVDQQNFI